MKNLHYILLLSIVFLISCATYGKQVNIDHLKKEAVIGKSTKNDILRICGEPLSKDHHLHEGTEVWHYAYVEKNITPLGLLAHVARVGSEWESRKTMIDVYFRKDVVIDIKVETAEGTKFNKY